MGIIKDARARQLEKELEKQVGFQGIHQEKESGFSSNCRKTFEGLQAERWCEASLHFEKKVEEEHRVENGLELGG